MTKLRHPITVFVIAVLGIGVLAARGTAHPLASLTSAWSSATKASHVDQSCTHPPLTAYILDTGTGVTPINLATNAAGKTIPAGITPDAIAVTPNGSTVYVTSNQKHGIVTPINACTDEPGNPIRVGRQPLGVVMSPNGRMVYALNAGSNTVTPIPVATGRALKAIPALVGTQGTVIPAGVTPNGKTLYVTFGEAGYGGLVTPINTASNKAERPIKNSGVPFEMAFSASGKTLYVMSQDWLGNQELGGVMAIDTRTNKVVANISVGSYPYSMALTPNGKFIYVANGNSHSVSVISTALNKVIATITVGQLPEAVAIDPQGRFVYVVNENSGSLNQISVATNTVARTIQIGTLPFQIAITPNGSTAYVDGGENDNTALPISLRTLRVGKAIPVPSGADEIVIGR